jgi:uncharacterized membrane protein YtjA (UPF0391 family)
MLKYMITIPVLLVTIIAGVLGYVIMEGAMAIIAICLFWFSLISFVLALLYDPAARNNEI